MFYSFIHLLTLIILVWFYDGGESKWVGRLVGSLIKLVGFFLNVFYFYF